MQLGRRQVGGGGASSGDSGGKTEKYKGKGKGKNKGEKGTADHRIKNLERLALAHDRDIQLLLDRVSYVIIMRDNETKTACQGSIQALIVM